MVDMSTPSGTSSGQKLSSNIDANTAKQAKFNKELDVTLQKANAILKAFGMPQMGGNGSGGLTTTGTFTNGAAGGSTLANVGNFAKRAVATIAGVAGGAAQALPSVQDTLSTQLLTSQARFSGMANVGATIQGAMRGGQNVSPQDMIQAVSMGTAGGLMPALPGYNGVLNGVKDISNVTGSSTTAMQAAVGLNQAGTVNRLRMFGINVRNANGGMNNPADIFKQVYDFASQNAGKKLTAKDIAVGSQSGNGLSNFLDFVAGGDQTLRGALQTSAMQFAQGGNLTQASTTKTGLTTAAQNTASALNTSKFGVLDAAAPAMSKGFIEGADLLIKWNKTLETTLTNSKLANDAVKQLAKAETIAADNIGKAGLSIIAVLASSGLIGGVLAGGKSLLTKVGGFFATRGAVAGEAALAAGAEGEVVAGAETAGISGLATGTAAFIAGLFAPSIAKKIISGFHHGSSGNGQGASTGLGLVASTGLGLGASVSTSASKALTVAAPAGQAAVAIAQTQLGTPYSWGGGSNSGPTAGIGSGTNTVGFDCSSFVRFVMSKLGVALPRTSQDQQKCGTQINPTDAQPGDLLFWGTPAHHVAIYAGNGVMIEAPHTGDTVKRANVDLRTVTSCSRVIGKGTGTTNLANLLSVAGGYNSTSGYSTGSLVGTQATVNELRGFSSKEAMSGGTSASSGLGLGADSSSSIYPSSSMNSGNKYSFINTKTGTLETANTAGTTINYGGVTVEVKVPQGAQVTAQDISKAIKNELKSLSISTKVATN